ncbi:putative ribonuclease H-like domain-containing protein [Tanacetum coccineum]
MLKRCGAIKSRFGEMRIKEMQKYNSKANSVSTKDANQKFLRSLPSAWSQVSLITRTKPGVDNLSFDDLYNNLRVFENDVKGSTVSSSSTTKGNQDSKRRDAWNSGNKDGRKILMPLSFEEYESDSEDEHVSQLTKEHETPSFASQQVKTPRETVKNQFIHSKNPKVDKKDCDFHEKRMAKQVELTKQKGKGSSQREIRLVWNNVQRVNHKNQFVPTTVLTRTGKIPVNTARASGTNNVSTARHNFNSQAVLTNAARKISTVKPFVNRVRPKTIFHKTHSPFRRPFNNTTSLRTNFSKQKVNTAEVNAVSVVRGRRETAVKPSAGCNWRPKRHYWHKISKYNGGSRPRDCATFKDPLGNLSQIRLGSKGIKREYSNARTLQQNGVAERKNMTLIEAARTMLADSFLPNTFWAEAVSTACYVLNRVLVTKPQNKTPYELVTVIMEYLVKVSKMARILELKQRHLNITVLTTNTPYPSKKTRHIYACTHKRPR